MDRDPNLRRSSAAPYRNASPQRGEYPPHRPYGKRRRRRLSPVFQFVILLLAVIVAVVFILIFAGRGCSSANEPAETSAPSSLPEESEPGESSAEPSEAPAPTAAPVTAPLSPPAEQVPEGELQKGNTMMLIGGNGYEYYYFSKNAANRYITAIRDAAEALSGVTVYDLVVPTGLDVLLPEKYLTEQEIDSQDQKKALHYLTSSINGMAPSVKTVPLFDALKLHNNEYIYFRTDRHWTQLGAYYGYVEFCRAKGISPVALDQFGAAEYDGFLGSFYQDWPNTAMENAADTVQVYRPQADVSLYAVQSSGETLNGWPVIQDGTDYGTGNKYMIFCASDQPYEEITNDDLSDGSACLVVKESSGNVFIPFLANHYQTVYAVDHRKYNGSIVQLAREKSVTDVIFLNEIGLTADEDRVASLENSLR